jgi:DNA-binding response OmpR family regulator
MARLDCSTHNATGLASNLPQGIARLKRQEVVMLPENSKRVLCVEDDESTCSMLCGLLGLIGCEVVTAGNVPDALSKISGTSFDLYLLDNWLPGGSGVDLCAKIRESDSSTPIIFYSAAAYQSDIDEALEAGAQAYLVKPGDTGKLVETVRRLLT